VAPSPKLEKFQKRGVVRSKLVRVSYFQDQGLEVFLEKLRAQGWYELFTNTQLNSTPMWLCMGMCCRAQSTGC